MFTTRGKLGYTWMYRTIYLEYLWTLRSTCRTWSLAVPEMVISIANILVPLWLCLLNKGAKCEYWHLPIPKHATSLSCVHSAIHVKQSANRSQLAVLPYVRLDFRGLQRYNEIIQWDTDRRAICSLLRRMVIVFLYSLSNATNISRRDEQTIKTK